MNLQMDPLPILKQIGFPHVERTERIYKWSPVYRFVCRDEVFVLKRTLSNLAHARELFSWQAHLQERGIRIVHPALSGRAYLQKDETVWVVYPFVSGQIWEAFEQGADAIRNAGELLGAIHAASPSSPVTLRSYSWPEHKLASMGDDLEALSKGPIASQGLDLSGIRVLLHEHIERESRLRNAGLPFANAVWDFKRNNLVFQDQIPTLVDSDSAGFIPRIFDIALAVLLFNNELPSTSPTVGPFHKHEFREFIEGYAGRIQLTDSEKQYWSHALKFMYVEECLWALLDNDTDAWEQKNQGHFLRELATLPSRLDDLNWSF